MFNNETFLRNPQHNSLVFLSNSHSLYQTGCILLKETQPRLSHFKLSSNHQCLPLPRENPDFVNNHIIHQCELDQSGRCPFSPMVELILSFHPDGMGGVFPDPAKKHKCNNAICKCLSFLSAEVCSTVNKRVCTNACWKIRYLEGTFAPLLCWEVGDFGIAYSFTVKIYTKVRIVTGLRCFSFKERFFQCLRKQSC